MTSRERDRHVDPTTHLCSGFDRSAQTAGTARPQSRRALPRSGWKPKWLASAISKGGNCVCTSEIAVAQGRNDTGQTNKGNLTTVARLMVTSVPATMKKNRCSRPPKARRGRSFVRNGSVRHVHRHRHHVGVEVGDDPDEPAMTRKTISTPKARARILFVLIGPAADMQKEDEVDADLREGEHDQPDRYARRPQQICLRHDERGDRQQDGEPEPHRVR